MIKMVELIGEWREKGKRRGITFTMTKGVLENEAYIAKLKTHIAKKHGVPEGKITWTTKEK